MIILKKYIAPFLGISIAFPILSLLLYALFNSNSIYNATNISDLESYFSNTLLLIVGAGFFTIVIGAFTGYLNARFEYFGSSFFNLSFILPLAFPAYILGYCYVGIFEYGGILSELTNGGFKKLDILNIYGAIFIFTIAMFPYVYILARVSFSSISSTTTELIALQNISKTKAFFTVYLPLAYPALFGGGLLAIMEILSDYGTVLYFGIETFSVAIFKNWFGYGDLFGAINISLVLLVFVFSLLLVEAKIREKYKFVSSTNSSQKSPKIRLNGVANFTAFLLSFMITLFSFLIPLAVLGYWIYIDFADLDMSAFNFLLNTLQLNIISSLFIIVIAFFVIYFMRFYPTKTSKYTHKLSILGYSIPGAVVAVGVLLVSNQIDSFFGQVILNGSFFLLVFAYTTRYFAASIGSVENGFSKIDKSVDDAVKIFGKNELHTIFTVYLPQITPYLLSGFLILYIDIAKELPATLILRPFNYDTIAIRIYELASNEMLYKTAFPSLLLVLSTAIAVLLLNSKLIRGKK